MLKTVFIKLMPLIVVGFVAIPAHATSCNSDQFAVGEQCYGCPANATCDGSENYTCNDGWYRDASVCTACPPNSTCTNPDNFRCNPGTYLNYGKCDPCPNNATCVGGEDVFHCNNGYYRYQSQCISCANHVCDGETLISCGEHTAFLDYSYGQKKFYNTCIGCSSNMICQPGTKWGNVRCKEGFYKSGSVCVSCPSQYFCPQQESTIDNYTQYCNTGYYKAGNDCIPCPDGIECPGGNPDQITCTQTGMYVHSNGQCLPYMENDPGTAPDCNPGYYNASGVCTACPVVNSTCTSDTVFSCNTGYYKNNTICDICPSYATCNDTSGIMCEPGYWLNGTQCTGCQAGAGVYCLNNIKHACPDFNPDSISSLLEPGHIIDGMPMLYVGSDNNSDISNCSILHLRINSPQGTYWTGLHYWDGEKYWTSPNRRYYLSANAGNYTAAASNNGGTITYNYILPCTNGPENSYYTGPGSPEGNNCPWICNDGYYRDGDVCAVCPDGMNCMGGSLFCPVGEYADGGHCLPCSAGYDGALTGGALSINDCQIACPAGTYLATSGDSQCTSVGNNFWAPSSMVNYGNTGIRNQCPAGFTTTGSGAGADQAEDCGKVLRLGNNYTLRLRREQRTHPALAVQYGDTVLYGDAIPGRGHGQLRFKYHGNVYSVYNADIDE